MGVYEDPDTGNTSHATVSYRHYAALTRATVTMLQKEKCR